MECFQCVEGELQDINAEIREIQLMLVKLQQADTGEWHYNKDSIQRLSSIVSDSDSLLTQKEVSKAYSILKKHRFPTLDCYGSGYPRLSSLPPESASATSSPVHQLKMRNFLSSQSCTELNRYVVHEDLRHNVNLVPLSDTTSVSSLSTLETSLNVSVKCSSTESLNLTAISDSSLKDFRNGRVRDSVNMAADDTLSPTEDVENAKLEAVTSIPKPPDHEAANGTQLDSRYPIFDLTEYAAAEWKGNTEKAETIRKVSSTSCYRDCRPLIPKVCFN